MTKQQGIPEAMLNIALNALVSKLERENAALRAAGACLSNCAFNISQWAGKTLTPDVCASLDKCRRDWDAVPRALAGTATAPMPSPTPQEDSHQRRRRSRARKVERLI